MICDVGPGLRVSFPRPASAVYLLNEGSGLVAQELLEFLPDDLEIVPANPRTSESHRQFTLDQLASRRTNYSHRRQVGRASGQDVIDEDSLAATGYARGSGYEAGDWHER